MVGEGRPPADPPVRSIECARLGPDGRLWLHVPGEGWRRAPRRWERFRLRPRWLGRLGRWRR